ncbi:hypothetical protein AAGC94_20995 [Clostridium sporogenes]|uniref:response regulator transcription factor n=1 Tax=Clostridium TaxID=1485 RepID=UPI0011BAC8E9|nr:response regulator transcription factor [Clostridium cochlearium]MBU5269704.1 hypothetical protein [Clostridium cochlearium]MDU1442949.1 hypothetical protein [Clostridium cochlearium]
MNVPNILLVEDDLKINELIKEALTKENYNVDTVFKGEEPLAKFLYLFYQLKVILLIKF